MEFLEDFPKLQPAQKELFQRVVTRLLSGEVLQPGPPFKPDPEWNFVERFASLVESYLGHGGWHLDLDRGLRLARAVHSQGAQRVRFSKLESLLLCALRLHYHEQMRLATEEDRCELTVGDLRERLVQAGKPVGQLSARLLAPALRRLARHSLIQVGRGFEARDEERIQVSPLVEKVLSADRIHDVEERLRSYVEARASEEGDTKQEDVGAEVDLPEEAVGGDADASRGSEEPIA